MGVSAHLPLLRAVLVHPRLPSPEHALLPEAACCHEPDVRHTRLLLSTHLPLQHRGVGRLRRTGRVRLLAPRVARRPLDVSQVTPRRQLGRLELRSRLPPLGVEKLGRLPGRARRLLARLAQLRLQRCDRRLHRLLLTRVHLRLPLR